jgi:hypothetical protein
MAVANGPAPGAGRIVEDPAAAGRARTMDWTTPAGGLHSRIPPSSPVREVPPNGILLAPFAPLRS